MTDAYIHHFLWVILFQQTTGRSRKRYTNSQQDNFLNQPEIDLPLITANQICAWSNQLLSKNNQEWTKLAGCKRVISNDHLNTPLLKIIIRMHQADL